MNELSYDLREKNPKPPCKILLILGFWASLSACTPSQEPLDINVLQQTEAVDIKDLSKPHIWLSPEHPESQLYSSLTMTDRLLRVYGHPKIVKNKKGEKAISFAESLEYWYADLNLDVLKLDEEFTLFARFDTGRKTPPFKTEDLFAWGDCYRSRFGVHAPFENGELMFIFGGRPTLSATPINFNTQKPHVLAIRFGKGLLEAFLDRHYQYKKVTSIKLQNLRHPFTIGLGGCGHHFSGKIYDFYFTPEHLSDAEFYGAYLSLSRK